MSMPKTVIVLPSLTLGGAEKQALHYAKTLQQLGHKVTMIGLGKNGLLIPKLEQIGIPYETYADGNFLSLGRFKKLQLLIGYILFLRRIKPEVIISFTYVPNILSGLAWRFTGCKQFYWNQRSVDASLPVSRLEKWVIKIKPRYLANGIAPAKHIAERHGLDQKEVAIIRNYLEDYSDLNNSVDRPDISQEVHFIMVANFFPEKDHETVLRAFKLFIDDQETPYAHLHFVGNAPGISAQQEVCKALAFDLKLCSQITFHGKVADVKPLLKKCHIGILSTRSEGVSNAILEYMLYGLPVIATDILSNRDAIGDDDYPYLFAVGDHDILYQKLKALVFTKNFFELAKVNFQRVTARCNEHQFTSALSEALT
ncbi:MAG: glycosyltransferase [Flavobacteriales bacterium]|nr:glycosyltransferase [Flavobacteriales bacterium]